MGSKVRGYLFAIAFRTCEVGRWNFEYAIVAGFGDIQVAMRVGGDSGGVRDRAADGGLRVFVGGQGFHEDFAAHGWGILRCPPGVG